MRKLVAVMLCTLLVSSAFARPQIPAPRPGSLVAALGGRLAVLRSLDGSATYLPGQFTGVDSIAVTPDGRSIMVGPRDCEKDWIEQINIATGAVEDEFVGDRRLDLAERDLRGWENRGRREQHAERVTHPRILPSSFRRRTEVARFSEPAGSSRPARTWGATLNPARPSI